jgi:hypothetical protein
MLVKSVLTAANTLMVAPVVGAVLAVIEVFVCVPMLAVLLTKLAQFVAETVPPVLTVASAVCPYAVFNTALRLAPTLVLTKPL